MGIIKSAGDLVYTFRFLTLLTTPFENSKAFEFGIIDRDGKRRKDFDRNTPETRANYSEYYTSFHRLVFNIKKLMAIVPGGSSKIASYAAALYLLKEKYSISETKIHKSLNACGVDSLDFLVENTEWFMLKDNQLAPGLYYIKNDKVLNSTCEDLVIAKDKVRILDHTFPVGDIFGLNVYEAIHVKTNHKIYITAQELNK